MRTRLAFVAATLLSATVGAQTSQNEFIKYDGNTEYTSRGHFGGNAGFVSQGFAYGYAANLRTVTRISYLIQDQNASTQEPWNVGFTTVNAAGSPDYAKTTMYATNLVNPILTGIRAWRITHTPTTPIQVPATTEQWHHVWQVLQPASIWADGLGIQVSWGGNYYNTYLCNNQSGGWRHREIPRVDGNPQLPVQEHLGWSSRPAPQLPAIYNDCSWNLFLYFDEPVLNGAADNVTYNVSCRNPNPGYQSLDPDFADNASATPARFDDYQWNVAAGPRYAGGVAVMLFAQTVIPGGGVPLPGLGQLHLDLADPLMTIGPIAFPGLDGNGTASFPLKLGPPTSPLRKVAASLPSWGAQALVVAASAPARLSNLYTFRPISTPPGFTQTSAMLGTPASLPHKITELTLFLRNDGRGELTIQPKRPPTNIGPAFTVRDRSAVRIPVPPAATVVEVSSKMTNATWFTWGYNQ